MNKDYLKEIINGLRNEMNHLWGSIFITGGGAIGFSTFENKTIWIKCCIALGFFFALIFLNAYIVKRIDTIKLIEKLKNGD